MFELRKRGAGRQTTFVDDVLAGHTHPNDIHDYIERWHDAPESSPEASLELHEFFSGLSWDEYRLWGEQPTSLRFTLAARRAGRPVAEVIQQDQLIGAAARAAEPSDAQRVLDWLKSRNRI